MVRIESAGTVLDTYSDEPINLDINVQNYRDIGKVYAPISKTFTLPASDRNNAFFMHYYNVDVSGGFDAYTRTDCQLYVDSEQIFSGYLELIDCVVKNDAPVQYDVLVASAAPNLAKELEGKSLVDLDITGVADDTYDYANVIASWVGDKDIRYGLVGRRNLLDQQGVLKAYNNIGGTGFAIEPLQVSDFIPHIRLREVIKAIIEENGFRYTSNWLDNDTRLSNTYLMLGRDGGVLPDLSILSVRTIDVSGSASGTFEVPQLDPVNNYDEDRFVQLTFPSEIQDANSNWNTTNSSYTAPATGTYKFKFTATCSNGNPLEVVAFNRADITGGCDPYNGNGCNIQPFGAQQVLQQAASSPSERSKILTFGLNSGVEYVFYARTVTGTGSTVITDRRLTTVEVPLDPVGATIDFSDILPDISQKDFLGQVAKLYNLVFVPDRFDDKLLEIEPWVDWISSGTTFDLTPYVDQEKEISVKPTTELQNRSLEFAMGEGESYQDAYYKEQFNKTNATAMLKDTGNEFADGELKVETDFVTSIMTQSTTAPVQFPLLVDENNDPVDFGLRLVMWDAVQAIPYEIEDENGTAFLNSSLGYLPPYDANEPTSSDFYLGFSADGAMPDGLDMPLNNLFTEYWSDYIANIYDKDSRMVSLEAKLDSHILNGIGLNDQLLYKNQYYLIQDIKYNTLTNRAQLNLLKSNNTNPVICNLTPTSRNFRGVITFTDSDGNTTTTASKRCCDFYGFVYSGGSCYGKFHKPTTVTAGNTIGAVPLFNWDGDSTSNDTELPQIPVYNNVARTYAPITVKNAISNAYGSPVYDSSNATVIGGTTDPTTVTYTARQVNYQKVGRIVSMNIAIEVSAFTGSPAGNVIVDLTNVIPDECAIYDDGFTPAQPLGFATSESLSLMAFRNGAKQIKFYKLTADFNWSDIAGNFWIYANLTYISAS